MQIRTLLFFLFFLTGINTLFVFGQRAKSTGEPVNFLTGTTWQVDGVPFETQDRKSYRFSAIPKDSYDSHWGNSITFSETTFSSNYSAPCGMDCFTSVSGTYYFASAYKIHITVASISRHGFCEKESEELNRDYGYFLLEKTDEGFTVTQVN